MIAVLPARQRVRALAQGRGDGHGIAVPLAMGLAARIAERDPEAFVTDPTQLSNGLRDLVEACSPDGIPVTTPAILFGDGTVSIEGDRAQTALEATRRLRASMADRVALVACLPGTPVCSDGAAITDLAKAFLAAGVDAVVVLDEDQDGTPLRTLANIARFHQAIALGSCVGRGLPLVHRMPLDTPSPGEGLVMTVDDLPRDVDVSAVTNWVETVRG